MKMTREELIQALQDTIVAVTAEPVEILNLSLEQDIFIIRNGDNLVIKVYRYPAKKS